MESLLGLSKIKLSINQQHNSIEVSYHAHQKLFNVIAMIRLW